MNFDITFEELSLRNFLSFGNNETIIDLSLPGTALVVGNNVDTGGANGVGKTTIINAICFALYNTPFDTISLKRLINNTNAERDTLMEVKLTFLKGNQRFEIYRCRGTSTNIEIKCDGVDVTLDSVSENDKFIVETVGLSYELFTNIIVFAGSMKPFLEKPLAEQRKLIEELFNITILSEKAAKLKERIKITEADINIQEAIANEHKNAVTRYEKQLTDAETRITRWEADTASEIDKIKNQLNQIKDIDFDAEQELHSQHDAVTASLSELRTNKKFAEKKANDIAQLYKKTNDELGHLKDSKCPYCLQQYADAEAKVAELSAQLVVLGEEKTQADNKLEMILDSIKELTTHEAEISSKIKHKNLTALIKIRTDAEILEAKLKELESSVNPHTDAYEQLLHETVKEFDSTKIDELKSTLEHQQFLLKLLTDKNSFIRRNIINQTIPFLNSRINTYTSDLGLPHLVRFDDNMTCTVTEFGRELDFGNLSNGEKKRVSLALSLAFRDVLHQLHTKMNLMFIDEIDGGALDSPGIEAIISMIRKKTADDRLSMWIISHRPEMFGKFDREIIIQKENGFSNIIS